MPPRMVSQGRVPSRPINRAAPKLEPQFLKSYVLLSPRDTTVVAACPEVGCGHWKRGWETRVDEATTTGKMQAEYIRSGRSGREFRELPGRAADGKTVFRFAPWQRCFREHRTRPEVGLVRGGDWSGNPRGEKRVYKTLANWQEDFGEHQGRLVQAIKRG